MTPAMADERSMAFSRSRTRSCDVRRRFRIARQLGRGGVEQLAADVDAAPDALRQLRSGIELVAQGGEVRLAPAPQPRLEPARRLERVRDLDQLGRREPPAAAGPLERDAHVARAADAGLRLVVEQPRGLIGLVLEQGHV